MTTVYTADKMCSKINIVKPSTKQQVTDCMSGKPQFFIHFIIWAYMKNTKTSGYLTLLTELREDV